jgi:hypothetical protein
VPAQALNPVGCHLVWFRRALTISEGHVMADGSAILFVYFGRDHQYSMYAYFLKCVKDFIGLAISRQYAYL